MTIQMVHVVRGDEFTISRKARPGTGYIWQVVIPDDKQDSIQLVSEEVSGNSETSVPGDPVFQHFVFRVLKPGCFSLTLRFGRPWEGFSHEEYVEVNVAPDS